MSEPTLGMKFKKKASTPKTKARSSPRMPRMMPTKIPVAAEVVTFVTR